MGLSTLSIDASYAAGGQDASATPSPGTGRFQEFRSSPPDTTPYFRSPVAEDLHPGGKPAIPPGLSRGHAKDARTEATPGPGNDTAGSDTTGASGGPAIFIADTVVSNTNPNLTNTDTANDGETSIAINPQNPNEIVISAFSGGWGGGTANAIIYHSLDGGLTWTQQGVPPPNNIPVTGPNDWTFDYGRNNQMSGTVLNDDDIITGTTTNPANVASWQWNDTGTPPTTQITNINVPQSVGNSDQPWLLVNRNINNAAQDDVFVAYDDFAGAPDMRVAVSRGVNPPNFLADANVGASTGGVNPGLRMAKDSRTGFMYALWQRCTANCVNDNDNAKTIDFMLNRSTDGGTTWTLNGQPTGIVIASGDSFQPRPKFGTVNALLGGINHAAVDPNTGTLYYVYGDRDVSGVQRLALRRVTNNGPAPNDVDISGATWVSPDVHDAAIPSVAVTGNGTVSVFYYTFDGFSSDNFPIYTAWLALSEDQGTTFSQNRLLTFLSPATDNGNDRQRVLGDYMQTKALGDCFYGSFTGNGAPFGRLVSNNDPIFFKACMGPQMQVNTSLTVPEACVGSNKTATLNVCSTGIENLVVSSITSNNPRFSVTATSGNFPVNISPDSCFPFEVQFSPTVSGPQTATLTIASNDPASPNTSVTVTSAAQVPAITATLQADGVFGPVAVGANKVLNLEVLNQSNICDAAITNLNSTAGSADFAFAGLAAGLAFPVTLPPGANIDLPLLFEPTIFGPQSATFTLTSNDPDDSPKAFGVTGNSEAPEITVSGDLGFGEACANTNPERTVQICNVGTLNTLDVSNVSLVGQGCTNFSIVSNPFPARISHDFCMDIHVKYTPTGVGSHDTCYLVIASNDPDESSKTLALSGTTPAPVIDVAGDQAFPPTVNQLRGTCTSAKGFPIQNNGTCPLKIIGVAVTSGDYELKNLPSVPTNILPGEIFGDGALNVVFGPTGLARNSSGEVAVTYETDPITGSTETISREMCGEGVNTGARVLVTLNGVPLQSVDKIHLQRINANRNKQGGLLDTIDVARNVTLQNVPAPASGACLGFNYHREYGTVANPIQLLPGSYQVTVQTKINGKNQSKTVGFDVSTCDFNQSVIVNF